MTKGKDARAAVIPDPSLEKVNHRTPSPPSIKEIGGSGVFVWDMMMIDRVAMTSPTVTMPEGEDYTKKMAAVALRSFKPTDAVEGMIAAQAVALHHASLECSRRAMLPQQSADVASKLRRDAANSARAMVDMCEALDRRRGKGPQVIRVEKMTVTDGGQAVVGNVTSGAPSVTSPPAQRAIERVATPFVTGDAPAVVDGDLKGEEE